MGARESHVVCPRCGNPGKLIAKSAKSNTYYYVYHSRKRICYVGAHVYSYVTRLHEFELRGAHDSRRYVDYLEELIDVLVERLKTGKSSERDEIIRALRRAKERIERALSEL